MFFQKRKSGIYEFSWCDYKSLKEIDKGMKDIEEMYKVRDALVECDRIGKETLEITVDISCKNVLYATQQFSHWVVDYIEHHEDNKTTLYFRNCNNLSPSVKHFNINENRINNEVK